MKKSIDFSRFVDKEHPVTNIADQNARTHLAGDKAADVISSVLDGHSRMAVVDEKAHFKGMIRSLDVLSFLGGGDKYSRFLSGRLGAKAENIMETSVHAVTPKHTVGKTLEGMVKRNIDSCPLLVGKKFSALVTESSFVRKLRGRTGIKVKDVMVRKPLIVKDYYPLADVASIMVNSRYRRLPVASRGVLLGIVTPHDMIAYLRARNLLHDLKAQTLPISEVMNRNVVAVRPNDDLAVAIDKMKSGYGGLPVTDEHELLGIVTERDVLERLA